MKAFDILGLDVTRNWENIRSKFKKLVKKFHPDMNAGNKKFEEKLKIITLAYTQLKGFEKMNNELNIVPSIKLSVKQTFGIDSNLEVDAFEKKNEFVPEIDKNYKFDRDTTIAILSGFSFNKRVLVQGYHGTGKSTHIEQIAADLIGHVLRVNLDSHK